MGWNSATLTATLTPGAPLTASSTYTATLRGGATDPRIKDLAGNALAANVTWSFTTGTDGCPCTIWPSTATPAVASTSDTGAVNLGVKFRSDVSGFITGIRFYKGSANTGTHVGRLWSSTGQQLATATFTNETASGWQQVNFATPVAITANTVYVASYHAPNGRYAINTNYFASSGQDRAAAACAAERGERRQWRLCLRRQPRLPDLHLPVLQLLGGRGVRQQPGS